MSSGSESPRLTAVPLATAAEVLRRAGAHDIDADRIRADIAIGAPVNADGSINLLAYGAWLARELAQKDGGHAR
jgi:hypothetical protein